MCKLCFSCDGFDEGLVALTKVLLILSEEYLEGFGDLAVGKGRAGDLLPLGPVFLGIEGVVPMTGGLSGDTNASDPR